MTYFMNLSTKIKGRHFVAPLLILLFALLLIMENEYGGKEYKKRLTEKYAQPLIAKSIDGHVIRVYRTDLENMTRGEFSRRSVQVNYVDIDSGMSGNFDTQLDYEEYIHVGDTIRKNRNQTFFYVNTTTGKKIKLSIY